MLSMIVLLSTSRRSGRASDRGPRGPGGGRSAARVALVSVLGSVLGSVLSLGLLAPPIARAGNGGEGRSILRDADRPYTVVAGEADASAVVQDPANLAYLQGFSAILDFAINTQASGRRGSGVGLFAALPLPWKVLSLGVGVQAMWRGQASLDTSSTNADSPYGKFTVAAGLPLMRWAPGLAVGLSYSRLFAENNLYARGANQLDLGVSWRSNRFLTMAIVARNINAPRLEGRRFPVVLDPELALRPLGTPALEFAFGLRGTFNGPAAQVQGYAFEPRGRVLAGARGVRVFLEAELMAYYDLSEVSSEPLQAVRVNAGLQFDAPHFGAAAAVSMGGGTGGGDGLQGASGRLRASAERYTEVLPTRPRRVTRVSLAGRDSDRELAAVVAILDELAQRRGGVVLVEIGGTGFGLAQLEEVREALTRFQGGGGKVVAYLEGANLSHYFLASVADRVIAHPQAALSILGFSSRSFYWGELLGRLGVEAEFVRIAEYKGTPEHFSRGGPSAPVAEANRVLLTDRWNHALRMIARARARDPKVVSGWVDEAPWQPGDARRAGVVDDLAWPDELDAKLETWLGRAVRIEPPPSSPLRSGGWRDPAHVAVLHIDGTLVAGPSLHIPLLDIDVAGAGTLTREIEALHADRDVKAVVVRINSRGGSVSAARDITRALDLLRVDKPVVISMGETATSGGYYVATAGQYIYADASTVTGSIGIFYPKFDFSGFLDKFSVGVDMISLGDRATMRSLWKPYSEDERAAVTAGIQVSYDRFIDRVAAARAMTPEAADAVARGRIWSGVRAIEVGLVDEYGGMHEATDRAARMAALSAVGGSAAMSVRHYPAAPTLVDQIRSLFGIRLNLPLGRAGGALRESGMASVDPLTGRALRFADPILKTLGLLPASMWLSEAPEAMALGAYAFEIEG